MGIPLFDKNIRLSDCPICESINNDKSLEAFEDSLYDNLPIQKWKDPEYFDKNHIFLNNLIPIYKNDTKKYNVILHDLFSLYLNKKLIYYDELHLLLIHMNLMQKAYKKNYNKNKPHISK